MRPAYREAVRSLRSALDRLRVEHQATSLSYGPQSCVVVLSFVLPDSGDMLTLRDAVLDTDDLTTDAVKRLAALVHRAANRVEKGDDAVAAFRAEMPDALHIVTPFEGAAENA